MAARPVTFLVSPRKVTKRRRAYKDAACGGPLRYSDEAAGVETRTISSLRDEPRASNSRRPTAPPRPAFLSVFEGNFKDPPPPPPPPALAGEGAVCRNT